MQIDILSPSSQILTAKASSVKLPLSEGEATVLPGHTAMLARIGCGLLSVDVIQDSTGQNRSGKFDFFVDGGYVEVSGVGDKVKVLVDRCESPPTIDGERAKKALERANRRIFDKSQVDIDLARAMYAKVRAEARLRIFNRPPQS